jgi:hypothetical protein
VFGAGVGHRQPRAFKRAFADANESKKHKKLLVKPGQEITHLMAKSTVAVYEGVVEEKEE